MPLAQRLDPVRGYNFVIMLVTAGSQKATIAINMLLTPVAGFSECSGLETTLETEDYREGGNNGYVRKFPTRTTWSNIRLRRGAALNDDLWNWHYDFVRGVGTRRDGVIVLQNDLHRPVRVWRFTRGLPAKWTGPSLNASQSQIAIEEIEIAHEGLTLGSTTAAQVVQAVGSLLGL